MRSSLDRYWGAASLPPMAHNLSPVLYAYDGENYDDENDEVT